MKRNIIVAALGLSIALMAGCATRQQTGAIAGAGVGGLAGAAITDSSVGALIGAVFGAALGSEIGRSFDMYDRRHAAVILEDYESNRPGAWVNPDTGYQYRMTPTRTYRAERGLPCREFRMEAEVSTGWEEVYGTACRQPDGTWKIQS